MGQKRKATRMQGPRLQIMDIRWVLIAQFEVYGSIREVISAHSNVLSRFVSNQKMKDQTCKKSKNSHWSSHLLVAVDPDDPDDDGAERRRFGMSNWKFWATLEGYCCKSDTYGAKTKGHENAGTKIANHGYSLGHDCTI
ncbi:hypothetical protein F2Q68_00029349 [Brassica cretica]|uniref:Uncharacterized protein n=1 Tax=Brassica cretica TaxID=69181 RepID=A0A8S9GBU4_BRACR|nr:hypothetical protein F2Q68_00029349 [Brassica cretica]